MIGILSDAHGNRAAFDRAVDLLLKCGADRFIFLGDALGYLPSTGVLSSIAELGSKIQCVRGNHEDIILKGRYDAKREPVYQHERVRRGMRPEELNQVAQWPASLRLRFGFGNSLFVHGSPADPTYGYVYPDTDLSGFMPDAKFVFMGHTHRPFIRRTSDIVFVNVGSCGLPRDHGLLGCACLFDEAAGEARLVRFDIRDMLAQVLDAATVHPSVLALTQRQPQSYAGDLID